MKTIVKKESHICSLAILAVLFFVSATFSNVSAKSEDKEVTLRFSLKEAQVLKYKGMLRHESNYHGMEFVMISVVKAELSLDTELEDGGQRVALKFTERTDRRQRSGGEFQDFDGPVKPEGKTVRIVIDEMGKIEKATGYIIGIKRGKPLRNYVERWFFDLPEEPVRKESEWTREIPEEGEIIEEGDPELNGVIEYKLKKFEKKKGINVAVIKIKARLKVHQVTEAGVVDGVIESDGEVKIAVEGGYVVESKLSVEMKGVLVSTDDFTGEETSRDIIQILYKEVKLEK